MINKDSNKPGYNFLFLGNVPNSTLWHSCSDHRACSQ